jgi:hypothetical protein
LSGSCEVAREKLRVSELRDGLWACVTPDSVMPRFRFPIMLKG